MATTRLIPLHQGKGKTIAACIKARTDYAANGKKTNDKEVYYFANGRWLDSSNVYVPDALGRELAVTFEKGRYFYKNSKPVKVSYSIEKDSEPQPTERKKAYVKKPSFAIGKVDINELANRDKITLARYFNVSSSAYRTDSTDCLRHVLDEVFSNTNFGDCLEYIPTQFICEYIKLQGFDGIIFHSALSKGGKNVVLFAVEENNKKYKITGTEVFQVNSISIDYSKILPLSEEDIDNLFSGSNKDDLAD